MSLEELMKVRVDSVYGASKYEQKVTRAPASVSILTAEEISLFGYRTLAEALQSMRGLYVSNDRNYSYLGARGFLRPGDYNSRLLFLIDGHRMNDNVYDGAYVSREGMVSLDLVERIEFVRGPSSSIYGSSAFFGIVNIVLKRAKDAEGVQLSASAGSFGQHEATATLGGIAKNGLETTLSASYYQADGHGRLYYPEFDPALSRDPRAANGGMSMHADGERAVGLVGSAELGKFRLATSVVSRQKDVPTASFGSAFNWREQTVDQRGSVDLRYETPLSESVQLL
ncbi:MAG TPA: TonB-dependent receptor plug domain-containing protein, partial [Vicinamibacterales bacterium]|nr:TonB-dependent receptor plug domain-containing protein [Vicinamibacterales bacterium]